MTENPEPRTENRQAELAGAGRSPANESYSYRNLTVWQKAQELTLAIIKLTAKLPRDRAADKIADQVIRSSSSVGANIAEGHGRFTLAAHANYLSIAKASCTETDNWLDLLRRAGFLPKEVEERLHADCWEVIRMLTHKIRSLQTRAKGAHAPRLRDQPAVYGSARGNEEDLDEFEIYTNDDYTTDPVLGSEF